MTIITENNVFALGAILIGFAWLGFWVDTHPVLRKASGVIWVIGGTMALSNFHIIPFSAPAYDFVSGSLVPLAIPLLLFKADLRRIFRESGLVMITFLIASAATIVGAVLGFYILELGDIGPKVAGVYSGAYIGGAVNFLAVSQAVEMTEYEFAVALGASNVVSVIALMMLVATPSIQWIVRNVPSKNSYGIDDHKDQDPHQTALPQVKLTHISGALALSFIICALAQAVGDAMSLTRYNILFITILTIIVANLLPKAMDKLEGEFELGMLFMYIFFAAVGAGTNATSFISSASVLFIYGLIIIVVHLVLVLLAAKLLKIDLPEAIVASGAALVGPAATAAIAISRGWRILVTPAIMCGIFGYVIGTFIGVTVAALLN